MANGFSGKIAHVDLTNHAVSYEYPDEDFYRFYLGGSALGLHYVLNHTQPKVDALSPENTLVLALGVMTGAPISGQSRLAAVAKSPLTDTIGDAQSGGFFPAEMRFAGFDALVIHGRSSSPVYIWLYNGEAEIRPAEHLWGKVTGKSEELIRSEVGEEKAEVLQCGPAGERLVRFAALINMSNRANGRTGMGAVMGSKNLKAVAVRGSDRPQLADRRSVIELAKWGAENLESSAAYGLKLWGTAEATQYQSEVGGLPTRNWQSGYMANAQALDGQTIADTIIKTRDTCYACTIRCKPVVETVWDSKNVDPLYGGPEYETLAAFGSYCGVDDLEAVAYVSQICNMNGMDTISCGATIAWAMDCFEHGIFDKEDTGGLELRFGNAAAMVAMTERIAAREGLGDLLAEGSARAAEKIGRGSEKLVVAAKKQELPAHMPEIKRSLALIYAVNPFGADHQSHHHDPNYRAYPERMKEIGLTDPQPDLTINEEKVRFSLVTQHLYSAMDSVNVCQFVFGAGWQLYSTGQLVEAIRAITGWDVSVDELLKVGERRLNMLRAFNARDGLTREDDTLPKKLAEPRKGGKSDGLLVDMDEIEWAKDKYYEMAGWDVETGNPRRDTLEELGLGWVADELDNET